MLRRWHVLLMIAVVLLMTCLVAAAKLRATPKYDRVQVGMSIRNLKDLLGDPEHGQCAVWECEEGQILVDFSQEKTDGMIVSYVSGKEIRRRGPLERLAWLAGWR